MSDLICRKTMMRCQTPGMCAPYGGCTPQPVAESVLKTHYDRDTQALREERDQLRAENARLREALSGLMALDVAGHHLQDRLQFSTTGREILDKCQAALAGKEIGDQGE